MVQIKDLPEDVLRTLEARAAEQGQTLSDFLRLELEKIATRPTMAEVTRRVRSRGPLGTGGSAAEDIRRMREAECNF
jgi:hypothetical protein